MSKEITDTEGDSDGKEKWIEDIRKQAIREFLKECIKLEGPIDDDTLDFISIVFKEKYGEELFPE